MNNQEYLTQRKWSDQFIPQIEKVIIQHFLADQHLRKEMFKIDVSSPEDDFRGIDGFLRLNTNIKIAFRLRKNQYLKYKDFTFRYHSRYQQVTEWKKIQEPTLHYYFYGWLDQYDEYIQEAYLLDMNLFRNWISSKPETFIVGTLKENKDGSSFVPFSVNILHENDLLIEPPFVWNHECDIFGNYLFWKN
jgi:hypothetical protein